MYLTNIRELLLEHPAPFADDKVKDLNKILAKKLVTWEKVKIEDTNFHPSRIIGTSHPRYAGKTWRYVLKWAKRMNSNIKLFEKNPYYYLSHQKKHGVSFAEIEDYYYISEGNHRSTIAKFFFFYNQEALKEHRFTGFLIRRYHIHYETMTILEKIKRLLKSKEIRHIEIFIMDKYLENGKDFYFKVSGMKNNRFDQLEKSALPDLLTEIELELKEIEKDKKSRQRPDYSSLLHILFILTIFVVFFLKDGFPLWWFFLPFPIIPTSAGIRQKIHQLFSKEFPKKIFMRND